MTTKSGPGKSYRKSIDIFEAVKQFEDDEKANDWFVARRWPNGIHCLECGSDKIVRRKSARVTPLYHCNTCKYDFTVKVGTIMEDSKIPLRKWGMAFYLMSTHLKGVSSMKLHRDLGITQKSAWFMEQRIREVWNDEQAEKFAGPVEADETYVGGKEHNKHRSKKLNAGRGSVGKQPVAGLKDRGTNQVRAEVIESASKRVLQDFVTRNTEDDATVYTDEWAAYKGLPRYHEAIAHGAGEYVRGQAHTNGLESFWAMLKRAVDGVYHHLSVKHLHRYVNEFEGRHNARPLDTADQMDAMVKGAVGKRLTYTTLVTDMASAKT